jgi:hypothetical protein
MCIRVRARDTAGNVGPWRVSVPCVTTPLHDRWLDRGAGWVRHQRAAAWGGSVLYSRMPGARLVTLRLPRGTAMGLVVTKGPDFGRLSVGRVGSDQRHVLWLEAPRLRPRSTEWAGRLGPAGRFDIIVRAAPVEVDGLLITPRWAL